MRPPAVGVHGALGTLARVAAQRHDVAHAGRSVGLDDLLELLAAVWPTQVRWAIGRSEVSRAIRPVICTVVSRVDAARAVRHRDERRLVGLELADRLPELLDAGLVAGRA